MNTIAVIISVYKNDRLEYFQPCIESLLSQTYSDVDIWIQFDGIVPDSIEAYLAGLGNGHIFVRKRAENRGLACSLNELLTEVLQQDYLYIARMDADDISLPERFAKQVAYLNEHPETECLGTWAVEMDAAGNDYFHKRMPSSHDECLNLFRKRDCMIHPTVMFRCSYFEKAGLYPEDTYFGEDTMMWAQGFKNGCRFGNLPEYLFRFRLDENFFNRRRGWKHAASILRLRCRVNRMLGFGIKEDAFAVFYALAKLMPTSILKIVYKVFR